MRLIYVIVAIAFIDTFSQLPIIAPFSISLGASPLLVGLIIGMYSFSNIAGNILSGVWVDRIGAKKVLAIGMLLVGVILFFYSVVTTPNQLLFVRFLHGLAGGLIVPAAFAFLGTIQKKEKGQTMAFSGAAVGVAAIVGPAMGAIIMARYGADVLFYLLTCLMVLFGLLAALFLPAKFPTLHREKIELEVENRPPNSIWTRTLIRSYVTIFLLMFAQGVLTYSLPLKVEELFIRPELTGMLLSLFGIVAIIIFLLPTNRIFDAVDKGKLMTIGILTISGALFILSFSTTTIHLVGAMAVYGIGFAFIFPAASALVAQESGERKRGRAFGVFYACFSLGVIVGSFMTGYLALDSSRLFFIAAVILFFLYALVVIYFFKSKKKRE